MKVFLTMFNGVSVYGYSKHVCSSLSFHKDHMIVVLSETYWYGFVNLVYWRNFCCRYDKHETFLLCVIQHAAVCCHYVLKFSNKLYISTFHPTFQSFGLFEDPAHRFYSLDFVHHLLLRHPLKYKNDPYSYSIYHYQYHLQKYFFHFQISPIFHCQAQSSSSLAGLS